MLTRKQRSAEKRGAKVAELLEYFKQAHKAIARQYPEEAVPLALERTGILMDGWIKKSPQDQSFYYDVLVDLKDAIRKMFQQAQVSL